MTADADELAFRRWCVRRGAALFGLSALLSGIIAWFTYTEDDQEA